jgi:hypothetical protein
MYYPFLRARQFELIALRELAEKKAIQGLVLPVLEPVKESISNLNLANSIFVNSNQYAYLILNPLVGEKAGNSKYFSDYLASLGSQAAFLPAFHYTNNADFITTIIRENHWQGCMIVCFSNFVDDKEFRDLCADAAITHIMVLDPPKNRSLDRYLKGLKKNYIRLDDVFEKQEKNADFLTIPAHKFSEEHLYYKEDGYQGFSDFTVLSSEYTEGGSTPRAVAIHLTYVNTNEENQIWIRHFTSISNDSIANVQGKFAEAAEKAIRFCDNYPLKNSATQELKEYYENGKYPGLGTVKKISIKNHLLIVSDFLC